MAEKSKILFILILASYIIHLSIIIAITILSFSDKSKYETVYYCSKIITIKAMI